MMKKFNFGAGIKSRVLIVGFAVSSLLTVGVFVLLRLEEKYIGDLWVAKEP